MNWKLIFQLSLFGLFMGLGTVYFIPSTIEPLCWLAIFIISAWLIAKNTPGKYFLHGFLVSLVNCVWITGSHLLLFAAYSINHVKEMDMMYKMPMGNHPRMLILLTGPVVGIISGLVLGLFAFAAGKLAKKK